MANQYRKRSSRRSSGDALRSLMFVFIAFFAGYLTATYMNMGKVGEWLGLMGPESSRLVPTPRMASSHESLPKPKLEFYTLLTSNNHAVPPKPTAAATTTASVTQSPPSANVTRVAVAGNAAPTTVKAAPVVQAVAVTPQIALKSSQPTKQMVNAMAQSTAAAKFGYSIQVAALRTRQDAERMKANLLLRGFAVNVNPITTRGAIWYRVMVGPFASRAQAEKTQILLASRERMNGMIRRMDA
jgi:cell division protein FtsN